MFHSIIANILESNVVIYRICKQACKHFMVFYFFNGGNIVLKIIKLEKIIKLWKIDDYEK